MKIERGSVVITEIPYFNAIEVMPSSILLTRGSDEQTCHVADVEAIRDALTEALQIKREIDGVPAELTPLRVFHKNSPEPGPEITRVHDVDGATWHRHSRGWSLSGDAGSATTWSTVIQYWPLTEVRDA